MEGGGGGERWGGGAGSSTHFLNLPIRFREIGFVEGNPVKVQDRPVILLRGGLIQRLWGVILEVLLAD